MRGAIVRILQLCDEFSDDENAHIKSMNKTVLENFNHFRISLLNNNNDITSMGMDPHRVGDALYEYANKIKVAASYGLDGGPNRQKQASYIASSIATKMPIHIKYTNDSNNACEYAIINAVFGWFVYISVLNIDSNRFRLSEIYDAVRDGVLFNLSSQNSEDDYLETISDILILSFPKA